MDTKRELKKKMKTNSFVLFGRAFKNAKNDFWVSIQVLLVVTLVVALIFYFVEHSAQPEEYKNPWDAFVWAVTRYIGDPGKFAGNGPITLTGRYLDTFIGILKILIFAVPAGLVANGFRQAIADDKRKRKLAERLLLGSNAVLRDIGWCHATYLSWTFKSNREWTRKISSIQLISARISDFAIWLYRKTSLSILKTD